MKTKNIINEIQMLIEATPEKLVSLQDIYTHLQALNVKSSRPSIRARICERTVNSQAFWSSNNEPIFFRLRRDKKRASTYTLFKYVATDLQQIRENFQDKGKPGFEDLFRLQ
jgi:hypothetical protein